MAEAELRHDLVPAGVGELLADLGHADVARLDEYVLQAQHAIPMMIVQHARPHAIDPALAVERVRRLEQLLVESPRDDDWLNC